MNTNEEISSIIEKIIQNPEFAGMVSEIKGESEKNSPGDMSKEMMSKLPEVMSMVSSIFGGDKKASSDKDSGKTEQIKSMANNLHLNKYDKSKAEKLLYALRPYLSDSRCEIIDRCVSVMQITDVVGALQGLESFNKPTVKGGE